VLKVLTCISVQHDLRLVALAVLVCLTACVIAFRIYAQALRKETQFPSFWLATAGIAAGSGIWSTHFIAMLAYEPSLHSHYQPLASCLSWLAACIGAGAGFALAARLPGLKGRLAGGTVIGLSISAMHYIGMTAFQTQGLILWDRFYVVISVLLGGGVTAAAVALAGDPRTWKGQVLGGLILAGGIASMHFTAMTAVTVSPDPSVVVPPSPLSSAIIAILTAAVVGMGVFAILAAMTMARYSRMRALADLRDAIDALPAGLAFYDADDRLVMWNKPYAQQGGDAAHLLKAGAAFSDLLRAQMSSGVLREGIGHEEAWLAARLRRRREAKEAEEQFQNGRWLRVEDCRTASGGAISIAVDITDLKLNAEALAQARDQAEAANRAKSEFLANMSHELRTPLNGVIGVAHALGSTRLSRVQRDMLTLMESSARTLESVLSDLLDLARIDSGRLELQQARFGLGEVVREAAALWRLEAEKKGLKLAIDIAPEAEGAVEGDPVRLRQIVVNLLSNAVKFTEAGGIGVAVSRRADAPERVTIEITDTGVGFAPEMAEQLFERFQQADGSYTRRFGGTGLGLAICRDLTARMGGAITAEGEPGVGATFRVDLPLAPLSSPHAEGAEARSTQAAGGEAEDRPLRVLAAEDHPVNRKVVEYILQSAGAELICVENGALALETFKRHPFDAVLMDMQMPVMDGLAATRAIRAFEKTSGRGHTPVIMVTAHSMPEHVEASHSAGADRHLAKPIAAGELLATLSEVISESCAVAA
jgi:signal transduction histidine kinase/ActR/RegA family two-component response regulator